MTPATLLAKLAPHAGSYLPHAGRAFGALTPSDAAAALAFLNDPHAALWGRVKYAHQIELRGPLYRAVRQDVIQALRHHKVTALTPRFAEALTRAAICEGLADLVCPVCGGRKSALIGSKLVTCTQCQGRGWLGASERQRAEAAGLGRKVWHRWTLVYRKYTVPVIDRYEDVLYRHLSRAVGRD
jgi:hypothetical protein